MTRFVLCVLLVMSSTLIGCSSPREAAPVASHAPSCSCTHCKGNDYYALHIDDATGERLLRYQHQFDSSPLVIEGQPDVVQSRPVRMLVQHFGPGAELDPRWKEVDIINCCHPELLPREARKKHVFPGHTGATIGTLRGHTYTVTPEQQAE